MGVCVRVCVLVCKQYRTQIAEMDVFCRNIENVAVYENKKHKNVGHKLLTIKVSMPNRTSIEHNSNNLSTNRSLLGMAQW